MPKGVSEPESRVGETEHSSFAAEPVSPEPQPYATTEPAWQEPRSTVVVPAWPGPESAASENPAWSETTEAAQSEAVGIAASAGATDDAWWSAPSSQAAWPEAEPSTATSALESPFASHPTEARTEESLLPVSGVFFSGETSFFSLNGALQAIGKEKLTGTLRVFWNQETVELVARNGEIILVTTRDPQLYCPEAPITLVNVDAEQIEQARTQQRENGCPFFLALAQAELILHEPAVQLVQHYGQKLFAQLWTAKKVRFVFEQSETLPEYCRDVPGEADIDHWVLTTLRCIQFHELLETPETEAGRIPAYTRDGYRRVEGLRLTVAEAQFASQFNGVRSIAQIAKNLRLDFKFARLTLFRFLALEIVECWPPTSAVKQEKHGFFQSLGKSIGFGD